MPFDRELIAHWNLDRAEVQAYYEVAKVLRADNVPLAHFLI